MSEPIIQMKNVIKEFKVGGGFAKEETFRALQGVSLIFMQAKPLRWWANQVAVRAPARD